MTGISGTAVNLVLWPNDVGRDALHEEPGKCLGL